MLFMFVHLRLHVLQAVHHLLLQLGVHLHGGARLGRRLLCRGLRRGNERLNGERCGEQCDGNRRAFHGLAPFR
jgi:hypothetical protein